MIHRGRSRSRVWAAGGVGAVVVSLAVEAALAQSGGPTRGVFGAEVSPARTVERRMPEDPPAGYRVPAYFDAIDRADAEVASSQYRRALYTLEGADAASERVALIRAKAHAALGEWDAAAASLLPAKPSDAIALERARLLAATGKTDDAIAALRTLTAARPEMLAARLELGRLLEDRGDTAGAREAYAAFDVAIKRYNGGPAEASGEFASADALVTLGRGLDRWAALSGAYSDNAGLHNLILGIFVRAYDVADRGSVEARLATAEYLMSHDDSAQAGEELAAALSMSPRHPRALELLGRLKLQVFDFDGADLAIDRMRRTDPTSVDADVLEAASLLRQRRPAAAEPVLRQVLAKQPGRLEALGLLAAVYALRVDEAGVARTLAEADRIAPNGAAAYAALADQLGQMRQYPRAAAMYDEAIRRAPWLGQVRNDLGLLYTQSGDEAKAREVLTEARRLDPFNVRAVNYLKLLEKLDTMATARGQHFEVRTDASQDPFLGPLMLEYLEATHAELVKLFDHSPAVTTSIQVYPTHAQFSVRTTGTPWIGTVGASTGRVIAMVAPRDGTETLGSYNWAQVLRHEYAHTVTLSATENRIPHWMTEGLAVWAEQAPLRWEWVPMLYAAVMRDELFTMDKLTWGFVRPRRPVDRQLAYAQSYWMCRYLIDTYSREAMLALLAAFKSGRTEQQAFTEVLSRSPTEFHSEFVNWARQQVSTWGYDRETSAKYDALREKAEAMVAEKRFAEAATAWEEIGRLRPMDALPHQRLAGLYLTPQVNDKAKARQHLAALHAVELKDNRFARRLARLSADMNDLPAAVRFAREAVYIRPYDVEAHKLLLEMGEKAGDAALVETQRQRLKMLADLARVAPTTP